jgi:hypothetical protein
MSATTTAKASPSSIEADTLYHLTEFRSRMGWGLTAMRTARKQGLRVRYLGGRGYVSGKDFFAYLDKLDSEAVVERYNIVGGRESPPLGLHRDK